MGGFRGGFRGRRAQVGGFMSLGHAGRCLPPSPARCKLELELLRWHAGREQEASMGLVDTLMTHNGLKTRRGVHRDESHARCRAGQGANPPSYCCMTTVLHTNIFRV